MTRERRGHLLSVWSIERRGGGATRRHILTLTHWSSRTHNTTRGHRRVPTQSLTSRALRVLCQAHVFHLHIDKETHN